LTGSRVIRRRWAGSPPGSRSRCSRRGVDSKLEGAKSPLEADPTNCGSFWYNRRSFQAGRSAELSRPRQTRRASIREVPRWPSPSPKFTPKPGRSWTPRARCPAASTPPTPAATTGKTTTRSVPSPLKPYPASTRGCSGGASLFALGRQAERSARPASSRSKRTHARSWSNWRPRCRDRLRRRRGVIPPVPGHGQGESLRYAFTNRG
jgi:hypothetical protein